VELLSRGTPTSGTLHLTAHHLIFSSHVPEGERAREMWVCYPMIHTVERRQPLGLGVEGCALRFRCRDFNFFTLNFRNEMEGKEVFETVQKLTCVGTLRFICSISNCRIRESAVCFLLPTGEAGEEVQLVEDLSA